MNKKIVYISSPYTASTKSMTEANIYEAVYFAKLVRQAGFVPMVPHLAIVQDDSLSYDEAMQECLTFMGKSDAVLMCPRWFASKGCKIELAKAFDWNIPVFSSVDNLVRGEHIPFQDVSQRRL